MSDHLPTALADIVGGNGIITNPAEMAGFCTDWFGRYSGTAQAVVLPHSATEVGRVLALCTQLRIPLVPQGGNTSVCGGSVPDAGPARAVVLSLNRMDKVRSIDVASNAAVVEAGCVLARLQRLADEAGRLFPLSLSAEGSCQIGGTISTNAGGTGVLRYGTMRELVLGLEVVLPDGRIWDGLRTVRKDSSGYDLKNLWIGAEGTLGVITAAALKLFPQIRERAVAWVGVGAPAQALQLLSRLRERFDTRLVAFELMSRTQVQVVHDHLPATRRPLSSDHPWCVLLEVAETIFTGELDALLEAELERAIEAGAALDAVGARSAGQAADFWHIRHSITDGLKAAGVSLTHDVAVPPSAVPDYIRRTEEVLTSRFPQGMGTVVCHLGDGNVHYNLTFPPPFWKSLLDQEGYAAEVSEAVQDLAVELGGTFVAEHGIGRKFQKAARRYKSSVEADLAHGLKQLLDPAGIMNPGRTLPCEGY